MNVDPYRDRTRIRVNGLLVRDDTLLLARIKSPVTRRSVWMPPGGGLEFGESLEQCLVREFREETGLAVTVGPLRHINELIKPSYHAVEFYYEVRKTGGTAELGSDPEHGEQEQILEKLQFVPFSEFEKYDIAPDYVKYRFPGEAEA